MCCLLEIGLLGYGLALLFSGKATVLGRKVAGLWVRLAGFIFSLPMPVAFTIAFSQGLPQTRGAIMQRDFMGLAVIEAGLILGCAIVGWIILYFADDAEPPPEWDTNVHDGGRMKLGTYDLVYGSRQPNPMNDPRGEANPAAAGQGQGITAQQPVEIAPLPPLAPHGEFFPAKPRERDAAGRKQRSSGKQNAIVFILALLLFCGISVGGYVYMRNKDKDPKPEQAQTADTKRKADAPGESVLDVGAPNGGPDKPAPPDPLAARIGPEPAPGELFRKKVFGLNAASFSPDGRYVAYGDDSRHIVVWDVEKWRPAGTVSVGAKERFNGLTVAPDGRTVALWEAPAGPTYVRDLATGDPPAGFPYSLEGVNAVAFSPDGQSLAGVGKEQIWTWDVRSGRRKTLRYPQGMLYSTLLRTVRYTPDGKQLFTAVHLTGERRDTWALWNAATGETAGFAPTTSNDAAARVSFSADGRHVVWATDRSLEWWDREGPATVRQINMPEKPTAVAFAPDGRSVAVGFSHGNVGLWNLEKGASVGEFRVRNESRGRDKGLSMVEHLAFSADGKHLLTGHDFEWSLWDVKAVLPFSPKKVAPPGRGNSFFW